MGNKPPALGSDFIVSFTLQEPSENDPSALFKQETCVLDVVLQEPEGLINAPVVTNLFVPATVAAHTPQASQLNCTAPDAL